MSDIRTALSSVVSSFDDGTTLEYRALTSNVNAEPRTYGSWTALTGSRIVDAEQLVGHDPDSGMWYIDTIKQLRVPSSLGVSFTTTDQVRIGGSDNDIYSVRDLPRSAGGSVLVYTLAKREPYMQNTRQGGI